MVSPFGERIRRFSPLAFHLLCLCQFYARPCHVKGIVPSQTGETIFRILRERNTVGVAIGVIVGVTGLTSLLSLGSFDGIE
jgi:hypothetical protein